MLRRRARRLGLRGGRDTTTAWGGLHPRAGDPALTLPATAERPATLVVTDMAVIEPTPEDLVLRETAPGVSVAEVIVATTATALIGGRREGDAAGGDVTWTVPSIQPSYGITPRAAGVPSARSRYD